MTGQAGRGRLYLLRHGETEWNAEQRVMGRRAVPLSPRGREQVMGLRGELLATDLWAIWSSPQQRAVETARIAASLCGGLEVRVDDDLAEVAYGNWEGSRFADLVAEPAFRAHFTDPLHARAPGGGESLAEVDARVQRAIDSILSQARGRPVLVVSHGDPLRLVVARHLGLRAESLRRIRIDPGGLCALSIDGDRRELGFLNRCAAVRADD